MKYPISLDESSGVEILKSPSNSKHYPTLNLHWKKSYDLPEDGVLTVKYHKRKEINVESDDGDSQSVELEILTIESVKSDKEAAPKKSNRDLASDALDAAMEDVVDGDY